ncbi:MAG: molybdenum cofactor biosynthesis protein B [Candidatus Bathyarchaeia archaeon]
MHKRRAPKRVRFAVIIVSTSRHEAKRAGRSFKDLSGDLIADSLGKRGHEVVFREIVPDDSSSILRALSNSVSKGAEAIIFSGGTGISPCDVTIETIEPVLGKVVPGFGELFRSLSYKEIGSSALLSRALAGAHQGKVVFVIPGSPDAARLAIERLIVPEIGHILAHLKE